MKGFIHTIDDWIRHYEPVNEIEEEKVSLFHQQLRDVNTMTQLRDALAEAYEPSEAEKSSKFHVKLNEWIIICKTILTCLQQVTSNLEHIKEDETGLIAFCKQQLSKPQALFHYRIISAFKALEDKSKLSEMLTFLQTLPENPNPISTNPATFEAQTPTDELHQKTIQLLRNNAHQLSIESDNEMANAANGLLQNILSIHLGCQSPLKPIEKLPAKEESWCLMM